MQGIAGDLSQKIEEVGADTPTLAPVDALANRIQASGGAMANLTPSAAVVPGLGQSFIPSLGILPGGAMERLLIRKIGERSEH